MCKAWEDHKKSGISEGIEQGIKALVESCQELGVGKETAIAQLINKFSMTEQIAQQKIAKYWKL